MNQNSVQWEALQELREAYLKEKFFSDDYWKSTEVLESYELTLAQRIRWKWEFVLKQVQARTAAFVTQPTTLVDFGCGTGIAARTFLRWFPENIESVLLIDKSSRALQFAEEKLKLEFPNFSVHTSSSMTPLNKPYLLLVSHCLNELSAESPLANWLAGADAFMICEPGTSVSSFRLIEWREQLKESFSLLAPCPSQSVCGLTLNRPSQAWCHFFAPVPSFVFQSAFWATVRQKLHIDLRQLPLSYLVGSKKAQTASSDDSLFLSRPKVYKGYALLLRCSPQKVDILKVTKKSDPKLFKQLKKSQLDNVEP